METPENLSPDHSHEKKSSKTSKKKSKVARRFNDEQIKSLESIFKLDTKLDPKKKFEIARDLELQPRQVAIWFQNKRARWKSKQIEQEYKVLKANYDHLYMQFDDMKREKQSLQMQLEELNYVLKNLDNNSKENPNSSNEEVEEIKNLKYLDKNEEQEFLRWGEEDEEEISHLTTSPGKWSDLSTNGVIFNHSSDTSNWWET
ncbi:hypothetical protein BUALT_Bualt06G0085100 [Buddleja alternifolia]|uniref:Homeobox-leucine zipper protein n=1 Tax=Buddleja alternifolia TaxID=168488 RepID=A0AAV6XI27_9LAMI|nr:hypothetical protein BUALT_Bualt06G0085100 [Buddleja alternifolia]